MLETIKQVKEFLKEFPKYNITYSESSPNFFYLKNKMIKFPIEKENLKKEYELIYNKKGKKNDKIGKN